MHRLSQLGPKSQSGTTPHFLYHTSVNGVPNVVLPRKPTLLFSQPPHVMQKGLDTLIRHVDEEHNADTHKVKLTPCASYQANREKK